MLHLPARLGASYATRFSRMTQATPRRDSADNQSADATLPSTDVRPKTARRLSPPGCVVRLPLWRLVALGVILGALTLPTVAGAGVTVGHLPSVLSRAASVPVGWVNHTGLQPPFELQAPMAFDPQIHKVVLVTTNSTKFACKMYTWTYSGGVWSNQTSSISGEPAVTSGAGFVYDASDGYMLLYGGYDDCTGSNGGTWSFHNNTWSRVNATSQPPVGRDFGMTYDARDGYVILYGGFDPSVSNPAVSRQTWAYHAGAWSQVVTSRSPVGAEFMGLSENSSSGTVVLFGGEFGRDIVNQTWTYSAGTWNILSPRGNPPALSQFGMVFVPSVGFVVFGGYQLGKGYERSTWVLSGSGWTNLTASLSASPPIVYSDYLSATYDPAAGTVLVFLSPNIAGTAQSTWSLS